MPERQLGTIRWFNTAKGHGFIMVPDGPDIFVHYSSIQSDGFRTLRVGDRVEFECVSTPKGLAAANVRWVDAPGRGGTICPHCGGRLDGDALPV